jgi:hypothetical protein
VDATKISDEIMDIERKARMAAREAEYAALLRNLEGDAERKAEAEQEAEALLDGAPPGLPPPTTPPEPQKLGADTSWAEAEPFASAVTELLELRTKPAARFVGMFSPAELLEVADFSGSGRIDEHRAAACRQGEGGGGSLMSRTAARFTQADVARSIRAAKQAGAGSVELRPDGTILISLDSTADKPETRNEPEQQEVVL